MLSLFRIPLPLLPLSPPLLLSPYEIWVPAWHCSVPKAGDIWANQQSAQSPGSENWSGLPFCGKTCVLRAGNLEAGGGSGHSWTASAVFPGGCWALGMLRFTQGPENLMLLNNPFNQGGNFDSEQQDLGLGSWAESTPLPIFVRHANWEWLLHV